MKTKAVMTQIPVEKSCTVALGTGATAKTLTPIESSIAPANLLADWMTKERTVLVKKNKEQGAAVSNSTKIGQSFHKEIIFHEKNFPS